MERKNLFCLVYFLWVSFSGSAIENFPPHESEPPAHQNPNGVSFQGLREVAL